MSFWRLFLTFRLEGRKNTLLPTARSQFVVIGPTKSLKIGQQIKFLLPKMSLHLARELIHDHEFEHNDLLSHRFLVTCYDDFEQL